MRAENHISEKGILEFDLTDADATISFKRACMALDLAGALWDICSHLRDDLKYNEEHSVSEANIVAELYERLICILNERGICLDEIYT